MAGVLLAVAVVVPDEAALRIAGVTMTFVALLLRRWPGDGRVLIDGVDAAILRIRGCCWLAGRERGAAQARVRTSFVGFENRARLSKWEAQLKGARR